MNNKLIIKITGIFILMSLAIFACKEEEYTMGELTNPSNLVITTSIVGQNTANPNGDGSGVVKINLKADNASSYKIGYSEVDNLNSTPTFELVNSETITKKFNTLGDVKYRITVIAYGKGGTSTIATKDITVKSVYNVDPTIVTKLTNNGTKTWKVDSNTAGHFGVGPWSASSVSPEWWSANPNEKAGCCNCFYTARFTFKKEGSSAYSIQVATPDGVLTKTGSLTNLPGIPGSGAEGCYSYGGGSGSFVFVEANSGLVSTSTSPTTKTSILLNSPSTFIGYGALQKEYEILVINDNYMYLRVQGTETGNAWYIKLIPA